MFRIITAIAAVLLLSACGAPKIPVPDPTPLTEFQQRAVLDAEWASSKVELQSKQQRAFSSLRPTLSDGQLLAASAAGRVIAFNVDNGASSWETELNVRIVAGTGAGNGIAAVVSDTGTVYALDLKDGAKLWEHQLSEVVFAPPLVYQERVIMRTIDGNLIALDARSGEFLWDAIYDQPEFLEFGSAAPVGYQSNVIIGNALGRVIATEVSSGFDTWQIYLGSERSLGALRSRESDPIVFGNSLYLSDLSRAVVAYNLSTGNVKWENRRAAGRRLAVNDSAVFGYDTDSQIYSLDQANGNVLWQQDALLYRDADNVALVGNALVVSDRLGYFHVLDQASGEIIGRHRARERVYSGGLLVDGNKLIVYYRSGRIETFALKAAP